VLDGVKARKLIDGVKVKKLRVIPDERGRLTEMLRNDDEYFIKFGQLYLTTGYPGVVKGWHYHKKQIDNFIAVKGMMKVVLYDGRENSPTRGEINEFFMGEQNMIIVQIPTYVLHGFKTVSETEAILVNCPTEVYNYNDPDEFRVDPHDNDVPYDWTRKDG
jgi:dTDP-4-dehydrorhamnose 3,5-epimerase